MSTATLCLSAVGFALLCRTLPGARRAQAWLEGTWAAGKPLGCWTCLCFWGAFLVACARLFFVTGVEGVSVVETAVEVLAATGFGSVLLLKLLPIAPVVAMEFEIEEEEDDAEAE